MIEVIKKLILKLNNKEIELTIEEAKKLYHELDTIFGPKINITPPVIPPWQPYMWYTNSESGSSLPVITDETIICNIKNQLI